jgi:outer membrane protein assembly factor BamD (BamD/ComL family)
MMKPYLWLAGALLILFSCSAALAAERATLVREGNIYLTPDSSSAKIGIAERGRELIILETSRNFIHVEALLGPPRAPDAAFIEDDDQGEKTVTGWVDGKGVVGGSTPNGDKIIFGEAASSEDQASRRGGRKGAAQDAMRLYRRVFDFFPASPLAGEALYRAADIRWQLEKSDVMGRPSAKARESYLREGMNEDWMKQVIKKFPGTKWADLAAFHLIDNKLCGDWQGSAKCPDKEADLFEKYAREHANSPAAPEALYNAAWRRAALIEIYKTDEQAKKSEASKDSAIALAQRIVSQYPQQTDWASRAQDLVYLLQQGIPTYGNATE